MTVGLFLLKEKAEIFSCSSQTLIDEYMKQTALSAFSRSFTTLENLLKVGNINYSVKRNLQHGKARHCKRKVTGTNSTAMGQILDFSQ